MSRTSELRDALQEKLGILGRRLGGKHQEMAIQRQSLVFNMKNHSDWASVPLLQPFTSLTISIFIYLSTTFFLCRLHSSALICFLLHSSPLLSILHFSSAVLSISPSNLLSSPFFSILLLPSPFFSSQIHSPLLIYLLLHSSHHISPSSFNSFSFTYFPFRPSPLTVFLL